MVKIDIIGTRHKDIKYNKELANLLTSNIYDVIAHEMCSYRYKNNSNDIEIIDLSNDFKGELTTKSIIRASSFSVLNNILLDYKITNKLTGENDFKTCMKVAKYRKIPLALIDKDIRNTVDGFDELSFKEFYGDFLLPIFSPFNKYKNIDTKLNETILKERNKYMSRNIEKLSREYNRIACVVGEAHLDGIKRNLNNENINTIRIKNNI